MRRSRALVGLAWAVLVLGGCARPAGSPGEAGGAPALLPSLQATTFGDSVAFVLQVTNTTGGPMELEFASGQSYDFVVTEEEREVWRWSDGQMFTQALRDETLGAGETRTYRAVWIPPPQLEGTFTLMGVLTTRDDPVRQAIQFRIP